MSNKSVVVLYVCGCVVFMGLIAGGCWAGPTYDVWHQEMVGRAELAKANQNRQIAVTEAQAKEESAKFLAQAEVERSKGVAEANRIIGSSLQGNEAYLHYLWIQELANSGHVIYVPTEANLPILEAGRLFAQTSEENESKRFNKKITKNATRSNGTSFSKESG